LDEEVELRIATLLIEEQALIHLREMCFDRSDAVLPFRIDRLRRNRVRRIRELPDFLSETIDLHMERFLTDTRIARVLLDLLDVRGEIDRVRMAQLLLLRSEDEMACKILQPSRAD